MKIKYTLVKNKFKKYEDINLLDSYNMNKKKDKESIGIIKFYDKKMIAMVIKRKFDERFKAILNLLMKLEESDEDPSEGYFLVLDELDKLKKELINKYNKHLKKEQLEFLNKKIELVNADIRNKLISIQMMHSINLKKEEYDEEEKKTSRRR